MPATAATSDAPEPGKPHQSFGCGKIIRSDRYGHVEVTIIPRPLPTDLTVEWNVVGGSIPSDQREDVISASQRVLDSAAAQGRLKCGVRVVIDNGSFHDSLPPAHAEAAECAVIAALERGNFIQQEGET